MFRDGKGSLLPAAKAGPRTVRVVALVVGGTYLSEHSTVLSLLFHHHHH